MLFFDDSKQILSDPGTAGITVSHPGFWDVLAAGCSSMLQPTAPWTLPIDGLSHAARKVSRWPSSEQDQVLR